MLWKAFLNRDFRCCGFRKNLVDSLGEVVRRRLNSYNEFWRRQGCNCIVYEISYNSNIFDNNEPCQTNRKNSTATRAAVIRRRKGVAKASWRRGNVTYLRIYGGEPSGKKYLKYGMYMKTSGWVRRETMELERNFTECAPTLDGIYSWVTFSDIHHKLPSISWVCSFGLQARLCAWWIFICIIPENFLVDP